MASLSLTIQAKRDLLEIFVYIAEQSDIETAEKFLRQLGTRFELVADAPKSYRLRPELRPNIRSCTYKRYVILYQEVGKTVEITRVLHSARDIDAIFE